MAYINHERRTKFKADLQRVDYKFMDSSHDGVVFYPHLISFIQKWDFNTVVHIPLLVNIFGIVHYIFCVVLLISTTCLWDSDSKNHQTSISMLV